MAVMLRLNVFCEDHEFSIQFQRNYFAL
uniref:Uncharacterized protein n=1 Tax=Musa acuminata subsp. malaccensis TaxID=214687 RepID=A0A804JNU1_MUSAM